jgi:hypothetical protein
MAAVHLTYSATNQPSLELITRPKQLYFWLYPFGVILSARDKSTSLFALYVSDEERKFHNVDAWSVQLRLSGGGAHEGHLR